MGKGGNEARTEQAVAQQISEPFTLLHIRFVAWDRFHMLGVDQDHLKAAFQDVEDRSPIDAGTFHGDMGHLLAGEPLSHGLQAERGGGEGAHLTGYLARGGGEHQAGHDRFLMDIKPGASRVQNTHCHCSQTLLSAILAMDDEKGGGERRVRKHKFPARTHGDTRGDTQLCWTRQDQLETRTWQYQIPTISSRCRLFHSIPFSCSSLTLRCHLA